MTKSKTEWLEGVRGLAALQVMTHHVIWSIASWKFHATTNGKLTFLQLPVVRLLYAGEFSVQEFVLIAAFVSAIKPIKQSRSHCIEGAMSTIAKAAFKRSFRLIIPVTVMTTFACILCQLGAFSFSRNFKGSEWVRMTSPPPSINLYAAIRDLLLNNFNTWYNTDNRYEKNFWVMKSFLQASFYSYTLLIATVHVEPNRRFLVYVILYAYAYATHEIYAASTCIGVLLAELHQTSYLQHLLESRRIMVNAAAFPLLSLGLLFASYPWHAYETQWSRYLDTLGKSIFPTNANNSAYFSALGAQIILFSLSFTTLIQDVLAHQWLVWLGKVSWPLYLIHGTCIRTILVPVLYRVINNERLEKAQQVTVKETVSIVLLLPIFYAIVYSLAHLWSTYIDPICDTIARCLEEKIFLYGHQDATKVEYMPIAQ